MSLFLFLPDILERPVSTRILAVEVQEVVEANHSSIIISTVRCRLAMYATDVDRKVCSLKNYA